MDKRIKRTKQLLRNALSSLLETKKIEDISVTELCKLADINRSTFYLHYESVADACIEIERVVASEFVEWYDSCDKEGITEDIRDFIHHLSAFVMKYAGIFSGLYGTQYKNRQSMVISKAFIMCFKLRWLPKFVKDEKKIEILYPFIFDGCKTLYHYKITNRISITVDELSDVMSDMIIKLIEGI